MRVYTSRFEMFHLKLNKLIFVIFTHLELQVGRGGETQLDVSENSNSTTRFVFSPVFTRGASSNA